MTPEDAELVARLRRYGEMTVRGEEYEFDVNDSDEAAARLVALAAEVEGHAEGMAAIAQAGEWLGRAHRAEAEIAERKLVEADLLERKNAATEIGQELSRQKMHAEAEIAVLRRVVRAADYFVWPQDARFDEARAALVEFDRAAQKERE